MAVLFGSNYYEHRSYKYIKSIKLSQVVEALIVSKSFGPIGKSLADFIREIDSPDDKTQIQADFDSYCQAQDQIDSIFEDSNELCRRSITALSKCGDLSCDNRLLRIVSVFGLSRPLRCQILRPTPCTESAVTVTCICRRAAAWSVMMNRIIQTCSTLMMARARPRATRTTRGVAKASTRYISKRIRK